MFAIDTNVLLFASDTASPLHGAASAFLARCAGGRETLCLTWPTVMGYLRIATHPSVFTTPLTPADATANIEALMALSHVRVLGEEDGFWVAYRETTSALPVRGNLVPDAHVAAILRQHGVRVLYTHDRDFRRFDFLDARDPFATA